MIVYEKELTILLLFETFCCKIKVLTYKVAEYYLFKNIIFRHTSQQPGSTACMHLIFYFYIMR